MSNTIEKLSPGGRKVDGALIASGVSVDFGMSQPMWVFEDAADVAVAPKPMFQLEDF